MSRAPLWRALLALVVLGLSLAAVLTTSPRLGLDLRGGTQIVLETRDTGEVVADADATDRTLEVLRRRVDALGVSEPTLARSGEQRIIVELPGVQDPRAAEAAVGETAQLTFHPVTGDVGEEVDEDGRPIAYGPAALTGAQVSGARAELDQFGSSWSVAVDFDGDGDRAWADLTGKAACSPPGDPARRVAIVLDGEVVSSPQVDPSVSCGTGILGGSTQITGDFTRESARDLAVLVEGGALPVDVEVVSRSTVGPTLGADAIEASGRAGVIGLALTAVFLVVVYRLAGLLAAVGLASYGLISYAALVTLGATLTLPGLAGLLLSAGLAIDANVLVFERAREEVAHPRGLRGSLAVGFAKAWSAIADSAATTLLAAGLLFLFATGPVRGFGVTLCIGVLASLVSALLVSRVLTEQALARGVVLRRPRLTGLSGLGRVREWLLRRSPRLMVHRRRWLALSAVALLVATAGIALRGLELGVEFTGGRLVEYATTTPVDVDAARQAVADAGQPRAVVQSSDGGLTIRSAALSADEAGAVRDALAALGGDVSVVRDESVGPTLGDELRTKALIALGVALALQLAYLAVRYRWTFAAAAVLAMLHDLLIVVGVFAWLGRPVDGVFLAAALTIIGVSVNDSIVLLDRIRETWGARRTAPLEAVADEAILATAPRTVNTGIGAMLVLAALVVLGGDSLTDFALALLIGLVVGTWSSAFTATPLLLVLERWSTAAPPMPKRSPGRPVRAARLPRDSGAVV